MSESIAEKIVESLREHGFKLKPVLVADERKIHIIIEEHTDPLEESARVHCENAIYWNAQAETARKKITTLREALNKALDRAKLIDKKKLGYVYKELVIGFVLDCEEGLGKQPEKSDEVICEICGAPTEGKSICSPCYSAEVNG